jgi:hypothetical protein
MDATRRLCQAQGCDGEITGQVNVFAAMAPLQLPRKGKLLFPSGDKVFVLDILAEILFNVLHETARTVELGITAGADKVLLCWMALCVKVLASCLFAGEIAGRSTSW